MPNLKVERSDVEVPSNVGEVPGDVEIRTRCTCDQGFKGATPGVERMGGQYDLFQGELRFGHGLSPQAAAWSLRPSFTAMS